jgi:serine-type D-Ala-D-Ala carboxypeptidase (penicillin-binding protein 5/6)
MRRRRRQRVLALLLLATVMVLIVLVKASGRSGAGHRPLASVHRQRTTQPSARVASENARAAVSPYGRALAATQVHPRLQGALRSGLLFDVHTGRALWERRADLRAPIASLTKLMTALVVVSHSQPDDPVLITRQAVHFSGSGVGELPLGKRVPELALLYGLLLPSGNDAAIALAQHVAGTQGNFIAMMNARAHQMGLRCTHFTTVSGIVDAGNYSCTGDLSILAHAVLAQPILAPIVAARTAEIRFPIKGGKLWLVNNNPLLMVGYPGVDGVKTGYTAAAGPCLVAAARRGRDWLAVVLLHSSDPATQATELLNAGFAALRR